MQIHSLIDKNPKSFIERGVPLEFQNIVQAIIVNHSLHSFLCGRTIFPELVGVNYLIIFVHLYKENTVIFNKYLLVVISQINIKRVLFIAKFKEVFFVDNKFEIRGRRSIETSELPNHSHNQDDSNNRNTKTKRGGFVFIPGNEPYIDLIGVHNFKYFHKDILLFHKDFMFWI